MASDTTVFQDYTSKYYNISDKEILRISLKDKAIKHELKQVMEEKVKIKKPAGIDHYYIMEMIE